MINRIAYLLLTLATTSPVAHAQSLHPPVVVQPAASMQPASVQAATAAADSNIATTAVRALRELEAANDEMLKKQAATLERLEELEKAAEQIKIYTKRG